MEFANGTSFWDSDDRRKKAITFPRIDDTFKSDISAFLVIRPYETSEIGHADDKIHNEDIGIVIWWTRAEVEKVFWANHQVFPIGLIDLKKFLVAGWQHMAIAGPQKAWELPASSTLSLSGGQE